MMQKEGVLKKEMKLKRMKIKKKRKSLKMKRLNLRSSSEVLTQ